MWWNGASCCEFDGKSIETETTHDQNVPDGGKAIAEKILVSEEINPREQDHENHSLGSE